MEEKKQTTKKTTCLLLGCNPENWEKLDDYEKELLEERGFSDIKH